jgi:hypothetical protein
MTEINVTLNMDHLLDMNILFYNKSQQHRLNRIIYTSMLPIMAWLFFLLDYINNDFAISLEYSFVLSLVVTILSIILFPIYLKWAFRRAVLKTYQMGSNENILGKHKISIEEDVIRDDTDETLYSATWKSIDRIEKTKETIYIFVSSIQAIIIPINQMDGDQFNEIDKLISLKVKAAK